MMEKRADKKEKKWKRIFSSSITRAISTFTCVHIFNTVLRCSSRKKQLESVVIKSLKIQRFSSSQVSLLSLSLSSNGSQTKFTIDRRVNSMMFFVCSFLQVFGLLLLLLCVHICYIATCGFNRACIPCFFSTASWYWVPVCDAVAKALMLVSESHNINKRKSLQRVCVRLP